MFVTLFQICIFIEQARGDLSMCVALCVHLLMCCMCDREITMWFVFVLICVINFFFFFIIIIIIIIIIILVCEN